MKETLEELEEKYFKLSMIDHWSDEEYKYADELKDKIKKLTEKKEN